MLFLHILSHLIKFKIGSNTKLLVSRLYLTHTQIYTNIYIYILKLICHQLSAHFHFNLSSPWPCGWIDGEIKIGGVMLGRTRRRVKRVNFTWGQAEELREEEKIYSPHFAISVLYWIGFFFFFFFFFLKPNQIIIYITVNEPNWNTKSP